VTNVTPSWQHGNVAYERFTDTGPLALLPMSDHRCAWCGARRRNRPRRSGLDDAEFLVRLENASGPASDGLRKVGRPWRYPLVAPTWPRPCASGWC